MSESDLMREMLTQWWRSNIPNDNLIYKDGLKEQCLFVRKLMQDLFLEPETNYSSKEWDEQSKILNDFEPIVVGTHRSKSVKLPVMEICLPNLGFNIVLRYNFYDWCISVESEQEVDCDFMGLVTDQKGYFEGFPNDRIYERYSDDNKKRFNVVLNNDYEVYTFVFLLRNWVLNNNNTL